MKPQNFQAKNSQKSFVCKTKTPSRGGHKTAALDCKEISSTKSPLKVATPNRRPTQSRVVASGASTNRRCKKISNQPSIKITQEMVGTDGLIIDKPGVYKFCENLTFSPAQVEAPQIVNAAIGNDDIEATIRSVFHADRTTSPSIAEVLQALQGNHPQRLSNLAAKQSSSQAVQGRPAGITITSPDVYIDMKNYKLEQGNSTKDVVGFEILAGLDNITVVNGTITKFLGSAIHLFVDVSVPEEIQKVTNLRFENLNVIHNGNDGDETQGTLPATGIDLDNGISISADRAYANYLEFPAFENVIIKNCRVNNNTLGGIVIYSGRNILIQNTECNSTFINDNSSSDFVYSVMGLSLAQCDTVKIINSHFDRTSHNGFTVIMVLAVGMFIDFVNNLSIQTCTFNGTFGNSTWVNAIEGGESKNVLLENSQFNDCRGFANTGNIGFHMSDTPGALGASKGWLIKNCQFNNHVMETTSTSFNFINMGGTDWLSIKSVDFIDCQSTGHKFVQNGDLPSFGFSWNVSGFNIGCASSDPLTDDLASGRGFRFQNCTVANLQGIRDCYGINFFCVAGSPGYIQSVFGVLVENCSISYLRTGSAQDSRGDIPKLMGIYASSSGEIASSFMQDAQVTNSRIANLDRDVSVDDDLFSAGIGMTNVVRPIVSNNTISSCINGILFTEIVNDSVVSENTIAGCVSTGILFAGDGSISTKTPSIVTLIQPMTDYNDITTDPDAAPGTFRLHISNDAIPLFLQGNNLNLYYFSAVGGSNPFPDGAVNNLGSADGLAFLGGGHDATGPYWDFDVNFLQPFDPTDAFGFIFINKTTLSKESENNIITIAQADVLKAAGKEDIFLVLNLDGPLIGAYDGVVAKNTVSRCAVGYQDNLSLTMSSWVKNVASRNGVNYDVQWGGPAPIQVGYAGTNEWYNISLP